MSYRLSRVERLLSKQKYTKRIRDTRDTLDEISRGTGRACACLLIRSTRA